MKLEDRPMPPALYTDADAERKSGVRDAVKKNGGASTRHSSGSRLSQAMIAAQWTRFLDPGCQQINHAPVLGGGKRNPRFSSLERVPRGRPRHSSNVTDHLHIHRAVPYFSRSTTVNGPHSRSINQYIFTCTQSPQGIQLTNSASTSGSMSADSDVFHSRRALRREEMMFSLPEKSTISRTSSGSEALSIGWHLSRTNPRLVRLKLPHTGSPQSKQQ